MRRSRDSQRARVYGCDTELWKWATKNGKLQTFADIAAIEAFVRLVYAWTINERAAGRRFGAWANRAPEVRVGRGTRSRALLLDWRIEIASGKRSTRSFHYSTVTVLHELAHLYTRPGAGHGWEFCANYLRLVQHFMGSGAAAHLIYLFRERRVDYREPRKRARRELTPEQRTVLLERLAKAREAKAAKKAVAA